MATSERSVTTHPSAGKVLRGLGQRGHTAMGWFFGFKLHLPISQQGRIMALKITGGTASAGAHEAPLRGKVVGDKGYISKH